MLFYPLCFFDVWLEYVCSDRLDWGRWDERGQGDPLKRRWWYIGGDGRSVKIRTTCRFRFYGLFNRNGEGYGSAQREFPTGRVDHPE